MPTGPAARITDAVAHGVPPILGPGPGSMDVLIGFMPAWRGLPLAAAAGFMANAAATAARNTAAMARTAAGDPSGAVDLAASISQFAQSLSSSGADVHNCGLPTPAPHVGGLVVTGSPTVLINNLPACRMGDTIAEAGPPNIISMGCLNVIIGDMGMGSVVGAGPAGAAAAGGGAAGAGAGATGAGTPTAAPAPGPGGDSSKKGKSKKDKPKKITKLGEDVDKLVEKSPTLKKKLEELKNDGWTIKYRTDGKPGSSCDKTNKVIVIDASQKNDANETVQTLAHEVGHATYTPDPYVDFGKLKKEDYVKKNVNSQLKDEGEATLTNAEVRNEIIKNGGPDIGIAGTQTEKYDAIAKKYPEAKDRDKARQEIADVFADGEKTSTTDETYREYYSDTYNKHWDKHHKSK